MQRINRDIFVDVYKQAFPKPMFTGPGRQGLDALLDALEQDTEVNDLRWAAYMLATVKHECANTWLPIVERGKREYFDKYAPGTDRGKALGNTEPGDGFRFRGRGFVQLTGRKNYKTLGGVLHMGDQLVLNPDLALRSEVAYKIMSYGMRHGTFTGRRLSQFIAGDKCDYFNARRIINALDKADVIKRYAEGIARALSEAGQSQPGVSTPASPEAPVTVPGITPVAAVPAIPAAGLPASSGASSSALAL